MSSRKRKRRKTGRILLAAVLIAELFLGFFIPIGVAVNLGDALMAPTGLPHIIGYKIEEMGGALYPFDPFDPAMRAVNNEWHLRKYFGGGDIDVWSGGEAYEVYVQEVLVNCWVFLLLWVFLAVELVCIFRQRRREKEAGESTGAVPGLVAALLTPLLWAECIYLLTGTLHPLGSFSIAFVVFMSLFYREQDRARRRLKDRALGGEYAKREELGSQSRPQSREGRNEPVGQATASSDATPPAAAPGAVPEPPLVPRYCRKCGAQLIADSRYCSQCGAEVKILDEEGMPL